MLFYTFVIKNLKIWFYFSADIDRHFRNPTKNPRFSKKVLRFGRASLEFAAKINILLIQNGVNQLYLSADSFDFKIAFSISSHIFTAESGT